MYKIREILQKVDKNLKLDYYNRLCVKDTLSEGICLLSKSEDNDKIVEKLNNILSEYKYGYYIEYTDIIYTDIIRGVNLPSYTEKNDDIDINIEYFEGPKYFGYYILNIVDSNGKKVDSESWLFKEKDYRDDEFDEEFARAKRQCLNYIDNIKDAFNDTMEQFNKSEYKIQYV